MIPLLILSPLIVLAALGAVWKARPVHAALLLALTLALVAVFYLAVGADFVGLVQFMVYVGGVAILIVFALLITRPGDEAEEVARRPRSLAVGLGCVVPVLALLLYAFSKDLPVEVAGQAKPVLSINALGMELFQNAVPAVLTVGLLLTAVLIGAALFARDPAKNPEPPISR